MPKDPTKTRISQMDADEERILEMIKDRVNDVNSHNFDYDALLDKVEGIIKDIEDIAMEAEEGEYDKETDPDLPSTMRGCPECSGTGGNCPTCGGAGRIRK